MAMNHHDTWILALFLFGVLLPSLVYVMFIRFRIERFYVLVTYILILGCICIATLIYSIIERNISIGIFVIIIKLLLGYDMYDIYRKHNIHSVDTIRGLQINPESINNNCGICIDHISKPAVLSPCSHVFDYGCIKPWLKINKICPYCKVSIESMRYLKFKIWESAV